MGAHRIYPHGKHLKFCLPLPLSFSIESMHTAIEPMPIILVMAFFTIFPAFFVLTTSFIKISMVCILTRESLGTQQIPPNLVIYGLSLILSFYVMGPVYNKSYEAVMGDLNTKNMTIDAKTLINDFQ